MSVTDCCVGCVFLVAVNLFTLNSNGKLLCYVIRLYLPTDDNRKASLKILAQHLLSAMIGR